MSQHVASVVAFEPSSRAIDRFEANIKLNDLQNVRIISVALGERNDESVLGSGFPGNSGSRSLT